MSLAPGVGAGDIVNLCTTVYKICIRYKDAVDEFGEIAEKADSTAVVLLRMEEEAQQNGNLVERAGPAAGDQLKRYLASLKKDMQKLSDLVKKYDLIHNEGPGRRLLFALWESSGLTDLRRRIGYHESTLQMWYWALVFPSLRRLEERQEAFFKNLADLKSFFEDYQRKAASEKSHVTRSLRHNDTKPLEKELRKSGLDAKAAKDLLEDAIKYVETSPAEQKRMKNHVDSLLASESAPPVNDPYARRRPESYSRPFEPRVQAQSTSGRHYHHRASDSYPIQDFSLFSPSTGYYANAPNVGPREAFYSTSTEFDIRRRKDESIKEQKERSRELERKAEEERLEEARRKKKREKENHTSSQRSSAHDETPTNIVIVEQDHTPEPAVHGILKRSKSTSARRDFPDLSIYPSQRRGDVEGLSPTFYEVEPRRHGRTARYPIRSGYPSTKPTESNRGMVEVILEPHRSARDREAQHVRPRHNSETPAYRPSAGTLSPRGPGNSSGPLLEVPPHNNNAGGGGGGARLAQIEVINHDARPIVFERRPSGSHVTTASQPGTPREETAAVRPDSSRRASRSRTHAELQPRVEDVPDQSEVVLVVPDQSRRRRSVSRDHNDRRSSSTHSYVRRRTSSQGSSDGTSHGDAGVRIRKIDKMDRIDSMGT